jgi:hypothetical protein
MDWGFSGFGVLGIVAIIVIFFLYARGPSFKFGGAFKEEVKRQRRTREDVIRVEAKNRPKK